MDLMISLLAAYGVCFGLMNDKAQLLTDALKKLPLFRDDEGDTIFVRMLRCAYCTGFHAGWIVWCVFVLPELLFAGSVEVSHAGEAVGFAFASSAFCYGMDTIIQWFER